MICTSSKTDQDISLANHVPNLKKALETMVFRVQAGVYIFYFAPPPQVVAKI